LPDLELCPLIDLPQTPHFINPIRRYSLKVLKDRIDKLEWLVGKLTLENESLKKGLQNSLSQANRNGKSSSGGDSSLAVVQAG